MEATGIAFQAAGALLAGMLLAYLSARLIAKLLPRLGPLPSPAARMATALLTGALCAAFLLRYEVQPLLPAFAFLAVLGVQLGRIDMASQLLPNPLVMLLGCGGAVLLLLPAVLENDWESFLRGASGSATAFAVYLALALISPGALGMGDVKLAAPLGLYLGYLGWNQLLYGGLLGFVLNGLAAAVLLLQRRRRGRVIADGLAHGPSMLAATVCVALFPA